ncbi:hypothetical protein GINT2_000313 [Glugoides intestinalis]
MHLPEDRKLDFYITKLDGDALSWAADLLKTGSSITIDTFLDELESRFEGKQQVCEVQREFFKDDKIKSSDKFFQTLRNGTFLYNRKCVSTPVLLNALMPKLEDKTQAMLWPAISKGEDWPAFRREAEKIIWFTRAKKSQQQSQETQPFNDSFEPIDAVYRAPDSSQKTLFCEANGECNHSTSDCKIMKRLLKEVGRSLGKSSILKKKILI